MKSTKKYQIFISSTFLDLIEERQAAVEAIVKMGHIPAGMELFKAGKSQWHTITKWIDESDVYVLILGGRYGSLNDVEGKSYTHLEYEYALSQGKPVFALVLTKDFLDKKINKNLEQEILEKINKEKYDVFKKLVQTKIVKFVDDLKDIKIELTENIRNIESTINLQGWSRENSDEDFFKYMKQNLELLEENKKLQGIIKQLETKIEKQNKISSFKSGLNYSEIKNTLSSQKIIVDKEFNSAKVEKEISLLNLFRQLNSSLAIGVNNRSGISKFDSFIFHSVASPIASYGLAESKKAPGHASWSTITLNDDGKKFYSMLMKENLIIEKANENNNLI